MTADPDVNIPFRLYADWYTTEYPYAPIVIIPIMKYKSKDQTNVNNYGPIAIATSLSKVLEQVMLSRLARYIPACGLQTANLVQPSTRDRNGHICTEANSGF